ncbi:FtsX-like permease family protein [Maribacter sp. M208]|nr:FtsX-like permease family protein [Maribacter huludaoensis]MDF4221067.1 FtsX-like permease family protein [Maribacter huludaoensis]
MILSLSRGIEKYIVERNIQFENGALTVELSKNIIRQTNSKQSNVFFERLKKILEDEPEILKYSFRVYPPNCLLYFKDNSIRINPNGLSDDDIPLINEMFKSIDGSLDLKSDKSILLSDGISNEYDIKVGDQVTLMVQTADGTINLDDYAVSGIFRYTSMANKDKIYMRYDHAKTLYNANLPSKLNVQVTDMSQVLKIKDRIELKLQKLQEQLLIQDDSIVVTSFYDGLGLARSLSNINKYSMMSLAFFLLLISFVGIWSMQTENKFLREKETGTLLSFGFSRNAIKTIYIYESLYMSAIYISIGVLIMIVTVKIINIFEGIYLGDAASFAFGSSIINPVLNFRDIIITVAVAFFYPVLATFLSVRIPKNNIIKLLQNK